MNADKPLAELIQKQRKAEENMVKAVKALEG